MVKALVRFLVRRFLTEENFDKVLRVCFEEYVKRTTNKKK